MAQTDKAKPEAKAADKPKQKRTILTDAERLAKMEADLKAAREKAQGKAKAKLAKLTEQAQDLVKKRDALNDQIAQLASEANALKVLAGEVPSTAEVPRTAEDSETTES